MTVVGRDDVAPEGTDGRLVAYVAVEPGTDLAQLRHHLAEHLPGYLVPSVIVQVDALPVTAHGKVDRAALPAPGFAGGGVVGRPPRTAVEEILCGLFAEVLDVAHIGADDDFFELGGHSLLAIRLVGRINAAFGGELPVSVLFNAPTVADLAVRLSGGTVHGPTPRADGRDDRPPLSFAQQRLWFIDWLGGSSAAYHVPMALHLSGELDVAALRAAIGDVVDRHESLRTAFPEFDGEPHQDVRPIGQARPDLPVVPVDPADLPAAVTAYATAPFDLAVAPPLRTRLYRLGPREHVLVVVVHHIASDGWSMAPLARDLSAAYRARLGGEAPAWRPLEVQYPDYARWQRDVLGDTDDAGSRLSKQLAFWQATLAGLPDELELPVDRPRQTDVTPRARRHRFALGAELHQAVDELARDSRTTVFMVLHAALAALLTRMGAGVDIPIGTPTAGRAGEALHDMIGFFVNTLVLRTDTSGDPTFCDLLARVRDADLAAYANQDVPFEHLVEVLNPARSRDRHPLFQVMLSMDGNERPLVDLPGLTVRPGEAATDAAKFDLLVNVTGDIRDRAGLAMSVEYRVDLFDHATAVALGERLVGLLYAVTADPGLRLSEVDVLLRGERELCAAAGTMTAAPSLVEQMLAIASGTPDAVAVVGPDGETTTFGALAGAVDRLAALLRTAGAGRATVVAVAVPARATALAAQLAVGRVGGAYFPVNPSALDLDRLVGVAAPAVLLTERSVAGGLTGLLAALPRVLVDEADSPAPHRDPAAVRHVSAADADPETAGFVWCERSPDGDVRVRVVEHGTLGAASLCRQAVLAGLTPPRRLRVSVGRRQDADAAWDAVFALAAGHTVHLVDEDVRRDPQAMAAYVRGHEIDVLTSTPAVAQQLIAAGMLVGDGAPAAVLLDGEQVGTSLWHDVHSAAARTRFAAVVPGFPGYLMPYPTTTEAVGGVPVAARPLASSCARILDATHRPVPPGVPGELWLAADVAPRSVDGSPRPHRTGGLARWTRDGRLELVGGTSTGGVRVDPGEVAALLGGLPGVRRAAVVRRADAGDDRLIGYVVPNGDRTLDLPALRARAASALPGGRTPAALVSVASLPLTEDGLLDVASLPVPEPRVPGTGRPPRTVTEEVLCGLFAEILDVRDVSIDDGFFELGGHSLLVTRLAGRIRAVFGVELGIRDLFEAPSIAVLAARLPQAPAAAPRRAPAPRPRPERPPLSFAQLRLWFLDQLDTAGPSYHIPLAFRVEGRLDLAALEAALGDVVARHETLRTVFPSVGGVPYQQVLPAEVARPVPVVRSCLEDEVPAVLAAVMTEPFDLAVDPPLRVTLVRRAQDDHVLVLVLHHIAGDGWSLAPLTRDIASAYAARAVGSAPRWQALELQYLDYSLWQRETLGADEDGESLAAIQLAYWRQALLGAPEQLDLPADRPRPVAPTNRGGSVLVRVPASVHARLTELAHRADATMFMVLQAGVAALLSRMGAGTDIPLGTVVAGRADPALDDLVGFFVNTLVLRTDVSGDPTFDELLRRVRRTAVDAYAHQDLPFERLVEVLNPNRSGLSHPLFQVMVTLDGAVPAKSLEVAGLRLVALSAPHNTAKFDLLFEATQRVDARGRPDGVEVLLEYAADLFDHATATALAERLVRLLTAVAEHPDRPVGEAELMTPDERRAVLVDFNDTAADHGEVPPIHVVFEQRVREVPDRTAVWCDGAELSYTELNQRANQLARRLVEAGIALGDAVGVLMMASTDRLVGTLAILKVGAAYVPLATDQPPVRARMMLADAGATTVLVDREGAATEVAAAERDQGTLLVPVREHSHHGEVGDLGLPVDPLTQAYVMFTSGSTGRPKGVVINHRNVVELIWDRCWRLEHHERVLVHSAYGFDASTYEIWLPLLTGNVAVVSTARAGDVPALARTMVDGRVTAAYLTTGLFNVMADEYVTALAGLREVWSSGDVGSSSAFQRVLDQCPDTVVVHGYGPTETTVWSSLQIVGTGRERVADLTLGTPMTNTRHYVLDEHLRPVPLGARGELYIAGAHVAQGYVGRPGVTAATFPADPFGPSGARMYRTGDLLRWRADGEMEFLGRVDSQVKVRGFRVEPGEIEAAIERDPLVAQSAVVVREDRPGDKRIVAYLIPRSGHKIDEPRLRRALADALPEYLVPSAFVPVARLPLTPNGKLDRRGLPAPVVIGSGRAPASPDEELLCHLFAEALGVDRVGVDDDFFELGGHSLLAVRLAAKVSAELAMRIDVRRFFSTPTVAGLLSADGTSERGFLDPLLPLRSTGGERPLFCVHPALGMSWCYAGLRPHIGLEVPVYGLQSPGLLDRSRLPADMEEIVSDYLGHIRSVQDTGPYRLLGWSFGGLVAYAVATRLRAEGQEVELLALMDSYPWRAEDGAPDVAHGDVAAAEIVRRYGPVLPQLAPDDAEAVVAVVANHVRVMAAFTPAPYDGEMVFFGAGESRRAEVWRPLVRGGVDVRAVAADHYGMTAPAPLAEIGRALAERLAAS